MDKDDKTDLVVCMKQGREHRHGMYKGKFSPWIVGQRKVEKVFSEIFVKRVKYLKIIIFQCKIHINDKITYNIAPTLGRSRESVLIVRCVQSAPKYSTLETVQCITMKQ